MKSGTALSEAIADASEAEAPVEAHLRAAREWMDSSREPRTLLALVSDIWFVESLAAFGHKSDHALTAWLESFWAAGQHADYGGRWRGRLLWNARGVLAERPQFRERLFHLTGPWSNLPQPLETYAAINSAFPPLMSLADATAHRTFLSFVVRDALYPGAVVPLWRQGWRTGCESPLAAYCLAHGSVSSFEHVLDWLGDKRRPEDLTLAHVREVQSSVDLGRYRSRDAGLIDIQAALAHWSAVLRAEETRRKLDTAIPSAPTRTRARL